ncbi:unnamed protein product [Trypanosoma congolense IL3000]|uniref:WGS project CAEQ00000000 data, annotated contig 1456 n=1 Tax=Trypanosoma congolense (strain IL3000) TaxID=1068625 RepID=F9W6F3_TRYCI|nr:unnamed protein product [Trypanosoma congolense IL3000]
MLFVRVVQGGDEQCGQPHSKSVLVPNASLPTGKWCMLSVLLSQSRNKSGVMGSKYSLNVQLSLYTICQGENYPAVVVKTNDIRCIELDGADHSLRVVDAISLVSGDVGAVDYPRRFLLGSLGMFGGALSRLEVELLFVMGSDSLMSLSFMDDNFVNSLFPVLANVTQSNREKHGGQLLRLAIPWLAQGCADSKSSISISTTAFAAYRKKLRDVFVAGVRGADFHIVFSADHHDTPDDKCNIPSPSLQSPLRSARGRWAWSGHCPSLSSSLDLSCDADVCTSGTTHGKIWLQFNATKILSSSPLYSMLDALGGIPFFLCLSSLQVPQSGAFSTAWACACSAIKWHSTDNLLSPRSQHGDQHLVILIRAMLYHRVKVSELVAVSLCDAIGHRLIIRVDLLPLILDFTAWTEDPAAFRAILARLQQYINDDVYGYFNRQVLDSGHNVLDTKSERSALEAFILHILMHFSGRVSGGSWDVTFIPFSVDFLTSLCRTVNDIRQILRAVSALLAACDTPTSDAVSWAAGLLDVVFYLMDMGVGRGEENTDVVGYVIDILGSSSEVVRCKALALLWYTPVSRVHLEAITNTYLARKDSLKDVDVLCDAEFSATLRIVKRSAAAGDTHRGRGFLYFLITLLAKVPNKTQKDILFLFDEIVCKKGSFENDLLSPCEANEFPITLIYGCLVQALPSLGGNGSLMESFVKLMTQLSVDIVSTSWKRNNAQCGSLLGSISLAYLIDVAPMLRRVSQEGVLDDSVAGTLIRAYRHAADVLRTYSIHAEKGPITGPFLESYLFFLKSTAAVVILISRCERDYRISDAMKVEEENWLDNALNEAYIMQFKRPIQFGRGCIGARLCVLFFEKAQKLFFQLQSSQSSTLHTRQIRRTCQRLLLLQWKVAAFLLNDADMKGNEFIKELILLHITNGGSALHGFKFSSWREREKLVEPPLNSDWRHLQFAPGALITELLSVDYDRVLKEVAPWLIICRGASGFLNESRRKNPNRFNMVVSVCRLVRYNKAIWSLVKGGIAPSSFSELDVRIKSNSVTPAGDTLNSFSTGGKEDTQWEVELCRSGVVSLERYISGIHSAALSSLNQLIQLGRFFFVPAGTKHGSASRSQVHSDEQAFRDSVVQWIDAHERYTGENAIAVLAAYAAYRFSLLPWWGQCVNIHAPSPVELDQWELDRFMGPEWQRIRFRRLIYDARIHHTQPKEHVIQCVHWESTPLVDDMELLRFYSVTAVPQLLSAGCAARQPFTVKCLLVLPMTRTSVLLSVSPDAISYEGEQVIPTAGVPPRGPVTAAPDSHPRETPPEQPSDSCESAIREVNSPWPNRDAQCRRRVFYPSDVRAVWRRRNLLRPCALEVLFATGESLFLAFDSSDTRDVVLDILVTVTRPYLDSTLTLSESNLKMWRNWWCEGCITNFHYLMYLNFAAGRSYGDMRQYPVFPHVVADFTSPLLDLNSPSTYRQFSRPIGAQTQESAQRAEKNYLETSLEVGMITGARDGMSSYHYGSHYSPLGGALHFLVRVQPFSDYFVEMNSKLDDAGRVFDSLAAAYTISTGGKDVKELLPEFYCLPNLLVNSNRIPFGTKQDGSIVDDVQLPPWAESPRDLVVTLRNALEGSYVSENLHLWIDLIFGYRQRGKEAVSALNVFHPLTYEGSVDLSAVTDPVLRRSHETQINCFGQTPVQLFLKPHRQRYESSDIGFQQTPCSTLSYDTSLSDSCILLHPTKIVPAGTFRHQNGTSAFFPRTKFIVVGATEERTERKLQETQAWPVVLPRGVLPFTVTNGQVKDCLRYKGNRISVVNGQDLSCEINSFYVGRGRISSLAVEPPTVYAGMESGAIHVSRITYEPFQRGELPSSDGSGTLLDLKDIMKRSLHGGGRQSPRRKTVCRTLCVLYGHTARVTALHSSAEWGVLVSLSEDCNAAVWDARRCVLLRVIPSPLASPSYVKHLARNTMTCHICSDERHWQFYLVTVNAKHGDIILAGKSPAYSHGIRRYTINGELLGTFEFGKWPAGALLSVGDIVFVAERRRVHVLRGSGLEWLGDVTHPGLEGSIESLALSPNGCVLAACDQEEVLVTWRVSLR